MQATASLTDTLRAEGFSPGAPRSILPITLAIDAKAARGTRCPECGYRGLTMAPYHRGKVYRAIGVCDRCKHEIEL